MDLDEQGGVLMMDGYKWRGTEYGLESRGYLVLHGSTAVHQSASQPQSFSLFVSSAIQNLTREL